MSTIILTGLLIAVSLVAFFGGYNVGYRRGFHFTFDALAEAHTKNLMKIFESLPVDHHDAFLRAINAVAAEDLEAIRKAIR